MKIKQLLYFLSLGISSIPISAQEYSTRSIIREDSALFYFRFQGDTLVSNFSLDPVSPLLTKEKVITDESVPGEEGFQVVGGKSYFFQNIEEDEDVRDASEGDFRESYIGFEEARDSYFGRLFTYFVGPTGYMEREAMFRQMSPSYRRDGFYSGRVTPPTSYSWKGTHYEY